MGKFVYLLWNDEKKEVYLKSKKPKTIRKGFSVQPIPTNRVKCAQKAARTKLRQYGK